MLAAASLVPSCAPTCALPAVCLELVELDLHDSVPVEEDVRDLVEADPRPVGEGDVDAGGEGRLAFPERLPSVRVDLPVRAEPGDPLPGRVGRPVGGQHIDRGDSLDADNGPLGEGAPPMRGSPSSGAFALPP
jgi:hypothetical protein